MFKKILIAASILLIISVGGAWIYALLHGPNPEIQEAFTEFVDGDDVVTPSSQGPIITDVQIGESPAEKRLRQLTTSPVAGAVFAGDGVYYVEQGTGHVRHIDLVSGKETLVSGTTIPGAYAAFFSQDGSMVAITTTQEGSSKTIVAPVPEFGSPGNLDGVALPLGATEIDLSTRPGVAYYLLKNSDGSKGYSYDIDKRTGTEIFNIPLRDVHVIWGNPLYVYTTPTEEQLGYVYEIVGNELMFVAQGGRGLMALPYDDSLVITYIEDDTWVSRIVSDEEFFLPFSAIPEKCVGADHNFFCAIPNNADLGPGFPDSWYKGVTSFSDSLWRTDEINGGWILSDFLVESGREIDVLFMGISPSESHLYFINKNDNTLWLYRL